MAMQKDCSDIKDVHKLVCTVNCMWIWVGSEHYLWKLFMVFMSKDIIRDRVWAVKILTGKILNMQDKFLFIQFGWILDGEAWMPYSFIYNQKTKIDFSLTETLLIKNTSGTGLATSTIGSHPLSQVFSNARSCRPSRGGLCQCRQL